MLTTAGVDFICSALGDSSGSRAAAATYLALTANSSAVQASDTTLTGEITTGGGGLIRAAATYAHTPGAASYTLTKTFTANGSDSLPVAVAKVGVFNASSSGTMPWARLLSATATISASGDTLTVTETISPS